MSAPKSRHRSWFQWSRTKSSSAAKEGPNECRYVCLRGIVEPVDKSRLLKSGDFKSTGVIHKIITKEVAIVRNGSRFW